jgi:CheY-like chemotaxis protein
VSGYILIVEDDEPIRQSITEILEESGYRVKEATHGLEALEMLRDGGEPPKLILLDWMMPVMNGADFLVEFLADEKLKGLPLVITSAAGNKVEALAQGQARFLRKPVQLDELLAIAAEFCG